MFISRIVAKPYGKVNFRKISSCMLRDRNSCKQILVTLMCSLVIRN